MTQQPSAPTSAGRITSMGCLYASAALMVLTLVAIPLDLPIARTIHERFGGDLKRVITLAEVFGYGWTAALLVIVTAAQIDARGWRVAPRLLLGTFGAGLLADFCKVFFVARWRPNAKRFQPETIVESFAQWFPWRGGEEFPAPWNRDLMSFPSGHTATATGLALSLSVLYPKGAVWFCMLAFFTAFQRIEARAHYLSDTLAGAAVACLFMALLLHSRWLESRLQKFEAGGGPASADNSSKLI
jgi:membrane-associated phospholipid phosphatase